MATVVVHDIRHAQRADGPAAVLAIGTANPANCVSQEEYPDYIFRVSKTGLPELKDSLRRICKHMLTESITCIFIPTVILHLLIKHQ